MFKYTETTVFNTNAQAIVNTVNCVGVMGAGLALEFKLRFPQMYTDYVKRCKSKKIKVGKVSLYHDHHTPYIINFPTKNHWKYSSELDWIEAGLKDFVQQYSEWGITSVAFPKLGCDRGGLNWSDVKLLLERYLNNLPNLDVYICLDTEINAQGLEQEMVNILNNQNCPLSKLCLSSSLIDKINKSLPIGRFKELFTIPNFLKKPYQEIFQLLSSSLQEKLAKQYYLDSRIFTIPDARIPLVMFLKLLGLSYKEISQLKLNSLVLVKQSNDFWGLIYLEKQMIIPSIFWEQMKINLNQLNQEYPLISYRNNPQKHLQATSIRKLISRGKKLINHNDVK